MKQKLFVLCMSAALLLAGCGGGAMAGSTAASSAPSTPGSRISSARFSDFFSLGVSFRTTFPPFSLRTKTLPGGPSQKLRDGAASQAVPFPFFLSKEKLVIINKKFLKNLDTISN